MTMPHERLRALEWAGELMREIAFKRDQQQEMWGGEAPEKLREQARTILRHYPTTSDLQFEARAAMQSDSPFNGWIGLDPFG